MNKDKFMIATYKARESIRGVAKSTYIVFLPFLVLGYYLKLPVTGLVLYVFACLNYPLFGNRFFSLQSKSKLIDVTQRNYFFEVYTQKTFVDLPWPRIATTKQEAELIIDKLLRFCTPATITQVDFDAVDIPFDKDVLIKAARREKGSITSCSLYDSEGRKVAFIDFHFKLKYIVEPYDERWD